MDLEKKRKHYYHTRRKGAAGECMFALQPSGMKLKQTKQEYVIVVKGLKHFVADVYRKRYHDLFVDNRWLRTSVERQQLKYPSIEWTISDTKRDCLFCGIARSNKEQINRVCLPVNHPGKIFVYASKSNAEQVSERKLGLAPLKLTMKNSMLREPLAIEEIAVCDKYKQLIKITKYCKKTLLAGDKCPVECLVNKNQLPYGTYDVPLIVSYQNSSKEEQKKTRVPLKFIVASPVYVGNQKIKSKRILLEEDIESEEEGEKCGKLKVLLKRVSGSGKLMNVKKRLHAYPLPSFIRKLHDAVKCQSQPDIPPLLHEKMLKFEKILSSQLTASNYTKKFEALLNLEDYHEEREIAKFNLSKVKLYSSKYSMFRLTVGDGLAEGRPSLMIGDIVFVTIFVEINEHLRKKRCGEKRKGFYGVIKRVKLCDIVFESEKLAEIYKPTMLFNVQFSVNRYTYRLSYRALKLLETRHLNILLPEGEFKKCYEKRKLVFFNEEIAGNPEQAQAITNIVNRSCNPYPYIIFGPPGTGKTKTLVEAILQNWSLGKSQLVCASSNSAADVIVEELLKLARRNAFLNFEPEGNILRIYSASVDIGVVSERILQLKIHNFDASNLAMFPPISLVLDTPIVVGTLATAAKISLEGVPANHFSHVFVDECGHCSEPECILAVAGLVSYEEADTQFGLPSQLVLAGDPQQLGTVVQCDLSEIYNFGFSLLERLLNTTEMYQRQSNTGKYNPEVVTKLNRNYRSHHDILEISNQLFYQSELIESGNPEILNSCSKLDFLPQKNHPIIFHGVIGFEEQDNTSPSYYNLNEIDQVVTYIHMLIEEANAKKLKFTLKDIGVVTPYKKQVQKLLQTFADQNWDDIAVGSVDLFQGSEKLIIIISTVRGSRSLKTASGKSHGRELHFINEPKRFNVALTRAKALLIVIGDPEILQHQSYWKLYMDYCLRLGTYQGALSTSYTRSNRLVRLSTPSDSNMATAEKKKEKKKKKQQQNMDKMNEQPPDEEEGGNLENGGHEPPSCPAADSVHQKSFTDMLMDLNIDDYADGDDSCSVNNGKMSEKLETYANGDDSCSENNGKMSEKLEKTCEKPLKNDCGNCNSNEDTCTNKNVTGGAYKLDDTWKTSEVVDYLDQQFTSLTISD